MYPFLKTLFPKAEEDTTLHSHDSCETLFARFDKIGTVYAPGFQKRKEYYYGNE